jgi:hypothetical protein
MDDIYSIEQQNEKTREALDLAFKPYIDVSFLFGVLSLIKSDQVYLDYSIECTKSKASPVSFLVPFSNPAYEAAKAVTATHLFNVESDPLLKDKINDFAYRQEVKDEVITMLRLRKYGQEIRNPYFFDEYKPFFYSAFITSNYFEKTLIGLGNLPEKNKEVLRGFLLEMCQDIKAIVVTSEIPTIPQALKLLRTLIDSFFSFSVLSSHKEAIKSYENFLEFANFYDQNGYYSPDFEKVYATVDKTVYKSKYAAYGWLDSVKAYKDIPEKNYVFKDIVDLSKLPEEEKVDLLAEYKFLCKFVHGSYSLGNYDPVALVLFAMKTVLTLLNFMGKSFADISNADVACQGVDLKKWLLDIRKRVIAAEANLEPAKSAK